MACHPWLLVALTAVAQQRGGEQAGKDQDPGAAGSMWLATFACCAAGLVVTLAVTRPLTLAVLVEGAAFAVAVLLGYATIDLGHGPGRLPPRWFVVPGPEVQVDPAALELAVVLAPRLEGEDLHAAREVLRLGQ